LNTFALPGAWIGVRVMENKRAGQVARLQGILSLAIACGPIWGSFLASVCPTDWMGYQSTGVFTLLESSFLFVVVCLIFDDRKLLSSRMEATASSKPKYDEAKIKVIILGCSFSIFCITMGVLAGFETLLGIAMYSSYGWRNSAALKGWAAFGVVILSCTLLMPKLFYRFNFAKIVFVCFIGTFGIFMDVNLFNISEPVPKWQFFAAFPSVGCGFILYTVIMTVVAVKIPKEAQVRSQSLVQFAGQLGRGFGPVLASIWYKWLTSSFGRAAGISAAGSFMAFWMIFGMCLPFRNYADFFGRFDDLSRYELSKEENTTEKSMH